MFKLIREKYTEVPLANRNLTGRTAIVTGSNVGLGFETALALLRMKPKRLVLAVRNLEKGNEAAGRLKELVSGTEATIDVRHLDLERFESVKTFAAKAKAELDRLDIIVENAAVVPSQKIMTTDGWESTHVTGGIKLFLNTLVLLGAKTTERGARNLIWAAVEDFESGVYIHMCKVQREQELSKFVTSPDGLKAQEKVFNELVTLLRAEGFVF
ncbi:NAD(P)-binding protein [Atractiella rhizophila]|nr:NAD(P)-binding protein [Atractiella rhizophila]